MTDANTSPAATEKPNPTPAPPRDLSGLVLDYTPYHQWHEDAQDRAVKEVFVWFFEDAPDEMTAEALRKLSARMVSFHRAETMAAYKIPMNTINAAIRNDELARQK